MFWWSTCKYKVVQTALVLYNRDWIHEITIDCAQFSFRNHALFAMFFSNNKNCLQHLEDYRQPEQQANATYWFPHYWSPTWRRWQLGWRQLACSQKKHLPVFGQSVIIDYQAQDQSGEVCPNPNVLLMLINHITFHVKFHPYVAWLSNVPNRLADQPSQPVAYPSNLAT